MIPRPSAVGSGNIRPKHFLIFSGKQKIYMCEVFILTYAEAKEYVYGPYSMKFIHLLLREYFLAFRGLLLPN